MKRNLKALGLALVAALALSAVAASAAQAANHHVTVGTAPAIVTAKDTVNTKFEITGGEHNVTCNTTLYEGTLPLTTNTEVTVTPTYSECKVDELLTTWSGSPPSENGKLDFNHCAYVLTGDTDVNGDAPVHVECAKKEGTEEDTEITINYKIFGETCTVHVTPQTPKKGVHYTQNGEKIKIEATVEGIKYHETHLGHPFCPPDHTGEDGTLKGTVEAEGFKEKTGCVELTGTAKTTPGNHFNECEGAAQKLELTTT
jgi:hypothetical protein